MEDIILYHGSRGGIFGNIAPKSREQTDFGKGFYLGTNDYQAKGLVCNESDAIFYTIKLRLSEIPENKILTLSGKDWLYTVLANRHKWKEFNQLEISKTYLELVHQYDVIIGPIADDRMNTAVKSFINNSLTNVGLDACLRSVNYGCQYVLKTPFACSKAEIISSYELSEEEKDAIFLHNRGLQRNGDSVVRNAIKDYQRQGLYFNEIIAKELEKEEIEREAEDYEL